MVAKKKRKTGLKYFKIFVFLIVFLFSIIPYVTAQDVCIWGYEGINIVAGPDCEPCSPTSGDTMVSINSFITGALFCYDEGDYNIDANSTCSGFFEADAIGFNINWDSRQLDCECYGKTWFEGTCCGDDTGENYVDSASTKSCDGTTACCPNPLNFVIAGECSSTCSPSTPEAYWSGNSNGVGEISTISVNVGITTVYMVAKDSTLIAVETVNYSIKEKDGLGDDTITSKPTTVTTDGIAIAEWTITQTDLDKDPERDYNDFRFTTDIFDVPESGGLSMTINIEGYCDSILTCFDYSNEEACTNNVCDSDIITNSITNGTEICADPRTNCRCEWINNNCTGAYDGITNDSVCDNDGVADLGEACDGSDLRGRTCPLMGLSGTLFCSNCQLTGCSVGSCPSGGVCNSTNLFGGTCLSVFNLTKGSLSCNASCQYESHCYNDNATEAGSCNFIKAGLCSSTGSTTDNCDNGGFLEYGLVSNWTWLSTNTFTSKELPDMILGSDGNWHCDGTNNTCVDSINTIACPVKIELPFFGLMNFVIAVIAIALIYVALNQKKRKH